MVPSFKKIIVGVSLGADTTKELEVTDLDQAAFDNAVWLASKVGAEIRLHHAVDWIGPTIESTAGILVQAARDRAAAVMLDLVAVAAEQSVTATSSVTVGPARAGLLETAERWGADLIVVGPRAHSTGFLGRLTYGSTALAAKKGVKDLLGDQAKEWRWAIIEDWVVRAAPKHASEVDADLVVIAGTSKPRLAGKILGTTAAKLLGRSTKSTLVLKAEQIHG